MHFADERYVRLYTRDTTTWKRLEHEGRCMTTLLLRKADRSGLLEIGDMPPAEAASLHTDSPVEFAAKGIAKMLELGVVEHREHCLVFPKYIEANETPKTDAARQRESRERRRDSAKSKSRESQNVTESHELSHGVTPSHTESRAVTPSVPSVPSEPSKPPVPSEPSENARRREDPSSSGRSGSGRFEKPPVGDAPPELNDLPKAKSKSPWLRVLDLMAEALEVHPNSMGLPTDHRNDLEVIAKAVEAESRASEGVEFDKAARRLLGAWLSDDYIALHPEKRTAFNLRHNLDRYKPGKVKSVRKVAPEDRELAHPTHKEWTKPGWMVEAERAEREAEAAQVRQLFAVPVREVAS
jgi:hypothetical protein